MAKKPNYGYEKRQKELARQAKKEEKKRRKEHPGDVAEEGPEADGEEESEAGSDPTPD